MSKAIGLDLAEIVQHRVDHLERLINFLSHFRTSQDDLATDEDEKHNLRLDHTINEAREELRLIRAEVVMTRRKAFKTNWELDIAGADNVLDLEIRELGVKAELLDDSCVFARRQARVVLRFGTSNHHLAGSKDQCGSLGLTDTHNDSGETLWIVFRIPRVKRNGLQIETAIEVDRGNDISSNMPLSL